MSALREGEIELAGWAHDLGKSLHVIGHHGQKLLDTGSLTGENWILAREIVDLSKETLRVVDRLMERNRSDVAPDLVSEKFGDLLARVQIVVRGLHPGYELIVCEPIPGIRIDDSACLFSILVNLVDNAMLASEASQPIRLHARVELGHLAVDVLDAGNGMSDLVRESAFQPYFSTRKSCRPTGLGLAECRRLIEMCGGEIRLESVEGQGTCASVLLRL